MEQEVIAPPEGEQTQVEGQQQEQQQQQKAVPDWLTKRFGELTAARRTAEQRAAELERQLAQAQQQQEQQEQQPVSANVEALARMYAEQIAEQKLKEQTFHQSLKSIESAGKEAFGDEFDRSIANLQVAGVGGQEFLQVLAAIPNPEKVVHWLGRPENMEQAVQIASLPSVQMAVELAKLAPRQQRQSQSPFPRHRHRLRPSKVAAALLASLAWARRNGSRGATRTPGANSQYFEQGHEQESNYPDVFGVDVTRSGV